MKEENEEPEGRRLKIRNTLLNTKNNNIRRKEKRGEEYSEGRSIMSISGKKCMERSKISKNRSKKITEKKVFKNIKIYKGKEKWGGRVKWKRLTKRRKKE